MSINRQGQKDQKDEYLIFLNTINARVVVVAQLVERRYWEVSGSILDIVTNIPTWAAIAQCLDVEGLKPIKKLWFPPKKHISLALHSRKSNIYWAKILEKLYFEDNDREVEGLNNKLIYFFSTKPASETRTKWLNVYHFRN